MKRLFQVSGLLLLVLLVTVSANLGESVARPSTNFTTPSHPVVVAVGNQTHYESLIAKGRALLERANALNLENGIANYPNFFTLPGRFYYGLNKLLNRMSIMLHIANATEETKDTVRDSINANAHQLGLSGVILFRHFLEQRVNKEANGSLVVDRLYQKLATMEPQLHFLMTNLEQECHFMKEVKQTVSGLMNNNTELQKITSASIQKGTGVIHRFFHEYSLDIPSEDDRVLMQPFTTADGKFTFVPDLTLQALTEELEIMDDFTNAFLVENNNNNNNLESDSSNLQKAKKLLVSMFARSVDLYVAKLEEFLRTKMPQGSTKTKAGTSTNVKKQ